jgi:hypothetical protein
MVLIKALSVVGLHELQVVSCVKGHAEISDVRRSGPPTTAGTQTSVKVLMPRPQTMKSDLLSSEI